jgi:SAM-dependent methyltransferase
MMDSRHDATGWFEPLYEAASRGEGPIPWDRGGAPHWTLVLWATQRQPEGSGQRAVVVGCGTGDDAAYTALLGYETTAFDISASAIRAARQRYPDAQVTWRVADLLDLPDVFIGAFDLVIENMTVQALPRALRDEASTGVARLVAPGGTLLVLAMADVGEVPSADGPPWPLTRDEVEAFAGFGLETVSIELLPVPDNPSQLRWIAEFTRPTS